MASFAGVIPVPPGNNYLPKTYFTSERYSKLAEWTLEHVVVSEYSQEGTTNICIGYKGNESMEKSCIIVKGSMPVILEVKMTEDVGKYFTWEDVKHLALSKNFLFIATKSNRLFAVSIKMSSTIHKEDLQIGTKQYSPIGKLSIHGQFDFCERPLLEIDEAKDLNIESMSANELALFLVLSNGQIFSLGSNLYGAAVRGQKTVQAVPFGEVLVKLKGKVKKPPRFTQVVGFRRQVLALTNTGKIYICGEYMLLFMGGDKKQNLYMFKELELPYRFSRASISHKRITAPTVDGRTVQIGLDGTVEVKLFEREEYSQKKLVNALYYYCSIFIYDGGLVEVVDERRGYGNAFYQFPTLIDYPKNEVSNYRELDCMWLQQEASFNVYFYWKIDQEKYSKAMSFFKKLFSTSKRQEFTDLTIIIQ